MKKRRPKIQQAPETWLNAPQGRFDLHRPGKPNPSLRAWDAADEYVLTWLNDHVFDGDESGFAARSGAVDAPEALTDAGSGQDRKSLRCVIVNDSFGALAVSLASYTPASWSDSFVAHTAARENLARNGFGDDSVRMVPSTEVPFPYPRDAQRELVDVLIIKVPKTLSLLEDQLRRIRPLLHEGTVVVGAGMTRTIHTSTLRLFEEIIGPTKTSLARKKARLIHATVDANCGSDPNPYPTTYSVSWERGDDLLPGMAIDVVNHASVFSRTRLDLGTKLLLESLPAELTGQEAGGPVDVVDLGCGNGVLGVAVAKANPAALVTFTDESYMAVASAEATFRGALGDDREATFVVGDALEGLPDESVDLVLCNPPFHDQNAIHDQTSWAMFTGSKRVLRDGGRLWVVGNQHLRYHEKLKRAFGNHRVVASNPKFVVLEAEKRRIQRKGR